MSPTACHRASTMFQRLVLLLGWALVALSQRQGALGDLTRIQKLMQELSRDTPGARAGARQTDRLIARGD